MREILVGLAVAAVLVVGIAVIYGGSGNKLSARDQALLTEFKQFRGFLNDSPIRPAMPDHLIKIFSDGTGFFLHFDKPVGQDSHLMVRHDSPWTVL